MSKRAEEECVSPAEVEDLRDRLERLEYKIEKVSRIVSATVATLVVTAVVAFIYLVAPHPNAWWWLASVAIPGTFFVVRVYTLSRIHLIDLKKALLTE